MRRVTPLAQRGGMHNTDDTTPDFVTTDDTQCEPLFEPLEKLLPDTLCRHFMAMYQSSTPDGLVIHAYKHIDTRRYLFIDGDGGTWRYTGTSSYCRIPVGGALEEAFCQWGDLSGYDPTDGALVAELIAGARA